MGKTSTAKATKGGNSISVTRNGNSYTVKTGNKSTTYNSIGAAQNAIRNAANSAGGTSGWSISGGGKSGGSSGSSSSYGGGGVSGNDWATKCANNKAYNTLVNTYGAKNVHDYLDYASKGGNSKSQYAYLLSGGKSTDLNQLSPLKSSSSNPMTTNADSGLGGDAKQNGWNDNVKRFSNAMDMYKQQGMSPEDAYKKAVKDMEAGTLTKTKEEEEAMKYNPDSNEDIGLNGEEETNTQENYDQEPEMNEQTYPDWYDDAIDKMEDYVDRFTTDNTESNVIEDKAKVSHDPIFDYQTYFKENLSGDQNVGETGAVENKIEQGPLSDVTKYDEETTQALQNLGFLQPDSAAAETMPNTVEQTDIKTFETPDQLLNDYDAKLDEMSTTEGLTPQAVAQTYVDYKSQLEKYIRDNNISEEEAAAMFDQLRNNEKFRTLLNVNNR